MNINVIITLDKVYTTYHKTICFIENFNPNNCDSKQEAVKYAQISAFNYGVCYGNCIFNTLKVRTSNESYSVCRLSMYL